MCPEPSTTIDLTPIAFPIGLGFVAGFVDLFGFMVWRGLLTSHVTGNLSFLAYDIARGHFDLVMKLVALPIFAGAVAMAAWFIGAPLERGRQPFQPVILLEVTTLGACLIAGLVLPSPTGPDNAAPAVGRPLALIAMGWQNALTRTVLNDLPPTTVMTTNITKAVTEVMEVLAGFGDARKQRGASALSYRAKLIGITLGAFSIGAIAGGPAQEHVGYPGVLLPIAVLLGLLPCRQAARRRNEKS